MTYDVVIIGGGPSGMSAGLEAIKYCKKVLLIEREQRLGGILNQCIHNGFGIKLFKEELTGVEYATRLSELVTKSGVEIALNTFAVSITPNTVETVSPLGAKIIHTKSIVYAGGCREKTAGAISLAGDRVAGVYTAGLVQKMINHYGKIPGKKVVVLGSGDIGLIMARRLTLQGVKVECVLEIMPTSAGLRRNITQCLDDFNIPLYLSHTVKQVVGKNRVEKVKISKVDENFNFIGDEKEIECDCLLLSVGLIPETEIFNQFVELSTKTKGAFVNEYRQTSCPSVFSSGNVLHIHDLADNASIEGEIAGRGASLFALGKLNTKKVRPVELGLEISYCIPQQFTLDNDEFVLYFRVKSRIDKKKIVAKDEKGNILASKFFLAVLPGEMQELVIPKKLECDKIILEVL